jgi:hypothetical protein
MQRCAIGLDDPRFLWRVNERSSIARRQNIEGEAFYGAVPPHESEERPGARLFDRVPVGYELTAQGTIYCPSCTHWELSRH